MIAISAVSAMLEMNGYRVQLAGRRGRSEGWRFHPDLIISDI
jgi:hypothetical protein